MSVLYGKRCPKYESPEIKAFFETRHYFDIALKPNAHPFVDIFPILNYIPETWAPWKRLCTKVQRMQGVLYYGLLDQCKHRMDQGRENGCYMEEVLRNQEKFAMDREMTGYVTIVYNQLYGTRLTMWSIRYFGGALIEGGSETTSSFLQSLVLLLAAFPEAQQKAQEEIDRVVGDRRSPDLEDFPSLPYAQAVIKEVSTYKARC